MPGAISACLSLVLFCCFSFLRLDSVRLCMHFPDIRTGFLSRIRQVYIQIELQTDCSFFAFANDFQELKDTADSAEKVH